MSSILRCLQIAQSQRQVLSASGFAKFTGSKKMYNNFGGFGNGNGRGSDSNSYEKASVSNSWSSGPQNSYQNYNNGRHYNRNLGPNRSFQNNQGFYNNSGMNHFKNYQRGYLRNEYDPQTRNDFQLRTNNGPKKDVPNAVMDLLGGYVGPEKIPSVLCAHLKNCNIGDLVELNGQLFRRTNKFAELRDKTGVVQLIVDEERNPELALQFKSFIDKSHTTVIGKIFSRPKGAQNVSIVNGDIEIQIVSFPNKDNILNSTLQIKSVSQAPQITLKRAYSTMSEANPLGITLSEYKHATTENLIQYFVNRDWTTAELTEHDVGKTVKLIGWLNDFNKNSTQFQQLKDGYGVIQVVALRDEHQKILEIAANSSLLVEVTGRVTKRPTHSVNVKIPTGTIEIQVSTARALGPDDPYDGPVKFKKTKIDSEEIVTNQTAAVNKFTYRTHNCSELRIENVGQKVTLCGWVQFLRMKKFIVLRDGYGVTQVLVPIDNELIHKHINNINFESVIRVQGTVVPRPENMKNPDQETGDIEVRAESIEVLNEAMANLPMDLREHNKAEENLRLTHRYIDLRSPDMQYNLRTRSAVIMKMRECLINKYGFVEVETPTLFRSTPGGAQEFLVPSRRAGKFYSLVQSPQQFKQMLMSGGIDRYFQVARCYRDEKGRNDRQPEFTQLDIELSFATAKDVMSLMEEVVSFCWPKHLFSSFSGLKVDTITYNEAMTKYGSDKPDTRFDWTFTDLSHIHPNATALILRDKEGNITNSSRNKLNLLKQGGTNEEARLFIKNYNSNADEWIQGLDKFTKLEGFGKKFLDEVNLNSGDGVILSFGTDKTKVQELLGRVRVTYRNMLEQMGVCKPRSEGPSKFLWVVDFPMFFKSENGYESAHHPFTAPHPDDLEKLKKKIDLESIRSQAYDLVLNGNEIAGGSIRIHDGQLQRMVLDDILKISHDHMQHLLNALESGCPPHGGIALGVDRFISIICKSNSIRDVIAFPKSSEGRDLMSQAPITVTPEELKLYNISVLDAKKDEKSEDN